LLMIMEGNQFKEKTKAGLIQYPLSIRN
jgi:hypothetical protein